MQSTVATRSDWDEAGWIAALLGVFATAIVASWIAAATIHVSNGQAALQLGLKLFVRESAALGALAFFATRYLRASAADIGVTKARASQIAGGFAAAIAFIFTVSPILARILPPPAHDVFVESLNGSTLAAQIFLLIMVGVYSPIIQELLFRGLLLTGLLQRLGGPAAVFLSAAIFALTHAQTGVLAVVSALCFGVLAGFLYVRLRSLTASIACHIVLNTVPIGIALLMLRSGHH